MAWTHGFSCSAELPAAWLILRWGPQTSGPLSGAHLALIVCLCTRNEQRSPTSLSAQAAIFFCKSVGGLKSTGDIEPFVFWAWVAVARIRNISPVTKKRKILPAFVSATIKGCILSICIGRPNGRFGHKNLSGMVGPAGNFLGRYRPLMAGAASFSGPEPLQQEATASLVSFGWSDRTEQPEFEIRPQVEKSETNSLDSHVRPRGTECRRGHHVGQTAIGAKNRRYDGHEILLCRVGTRTRVARIPKLSCPPTEADHQSTNGHAESGPVSACPARGP